MTTKGKYILFLIVIMSITACKEAVKEDTQETVIVNDELPKGTNIYATLVSKNGTIVLEEYYNGKTKDSLCDVQSLTKGLISILVGIAIDKAYIKDVDEPIENYFPEEYKAFKNTNKQKITIKHLLNQTSGLSWKGYLEHNNWLNSEDPIAFVLNKELEHNPGEVYNYNSGATHLLSVIISKASGKSTLAFAQENLLNPLGIPPHTLDWKQRNKGFYDGSGLGLKMQPVALMKLGQLLLNKGNWKGNQIVSKEWVEKLFDVNEKSETTWGLKNSKHGFCWYQSKFRGDVVDYGMGYGGQFIILIPSKDLVIVTTHNHDTPNGIPQQIKFLNEQLPKLIELK